MRDRDDAAAARADARDLGRERVDHEVVLELEGVVDERLAVDARARCRSRCRRRRADQVALADRLAERRARHRPRGGTGEDDPERLLERLRPGQERRRAVGEVERAGEARRAQLGVELVGVAGEDQLHEDVDHGRRGARVLLRERRGLRRDRHGDVRSEDLVGELAQAPLVRVVDVGVDQADRDALDVAAPQHLELGARLLLVEREIDAAVGEQPLDDPAAQVARDERPRRVAERAPPRRVGLRGRRAPDAAAVEHVAVALGGQEGDLRQGPRDHRVEPDRARVVEDRRARRRRGAARPRRPARPGRPRRSRPW